MMCVPNIEFGRGFCNNGTQNSRLKWLCESVSSRFLVEGREGAVLADGIELDRVFLFELHVIT